MEWNQPPLQGLTPRERQDFLFIMKLRRCAVFRELVHRLDSGKSTWSVTEWFVAQPDKSRGELASASFQSCYRYIRALEQQMRAVAAKVPRKHVDDFRQAAFRARVTTLAEAAVQPGPEPTDIQKMLTAEIEKLDVETMLKFCFAVQKERVMQIRKLETTSNITLPFCDKSIDILRKISSALWQVQAGQSLLRSKNAWLPDSSGQAERVIDLLPEVKEIAELDPVDQNLIREAFDKTIDLLQQEAGIGQYASRDKRRDKK
jgi:hypothetical protein